MKESRGNGEVGGEMLWALRKYWWSRGEGLNQADISSTRLVTEVKWLQVAR